MSYQFLGRKLNLVSDFSAPDWQHGDASTALKAAHDAIAGYAPGPYPTLVIPQGHYRFYQPALCQWDIPSTIEGDGRQATTLEFINGPFLVAPNTSAFAPVMGSDSDGSYYVMSGDSSQGLQSQSFDLGIDRNLQVNGLAQLSIVSFLKFTNFRGGPQMLVSSMGRKLSTDPVTSAFYVATEQSGANTGYLQCAMTINGTQVTISGGSLVTGQLYMVVLLYDGTNVSLYLGIPGQMPQLIQSHPASGAVTQPYSESTLFGYSCQDWPFATLMHNEVDANVYELFITNKAETNLVSNTTPHPLFQNFQGSWLAALRSVDGSSGAWICTADHQWIPARYLLKVFTSGVGGFTLRDLSINNMMWSYVQNSRIENVDFNGAGARQFEAWNNCFNNSLDSVQILGGSRFGFIGSVASGPWNCKGKIFVQGGTVPFVLANGSLVGSELELVPNSATVDAAVFKAVGGDTVLKTTINIDAESGEGAVLIDGFETFDIGGAIQSLTKSPLVINGGKSGTITSANFTSSNSVMIHIPNAPSSKIRVIGGTMPQAAQLTDNANAVTAL